MQTPTARGDEKVSQSLWQRCFRVHSQSFHDFLQDHRQGTSSRAPRLTVGIISSWGPALVISGSPGSAQHRWALRWVNLLGATTVEISGCCSTAQLFL